MSSTVQASSLLRHGRDILKPEEWMQARLSLKLSMRELEITQHIFDDHKAEHIAEDLGLSVHTVNTYLQRIYFKLEVHSRSQLVLSVLKSHLEHLARSSESEETAGEICNTGESELEHVACIADAGNEDLRTE